MQVIAVMEATEAMVVTTATIAIIVITVTIAITAITVILAIAVTAVIVVTAAIVATIVTTTITTIIITSTISTISTISTMLHTNLTIMPLMIGSSELFIIAAIVLLLFGGKKIPELMRSMGQGVRYFKKGMNEELQEDKKGDSKNEVELPKEDK